MRSYETYITFTSNPNDKEKHYVRVYRQPFHRWLIAWLYHWYDMHIFKVPGFRKFESWHRRKFGMGNWMERLPISVKQDLKCHFLSEQDKEIIATFEVDEATYQKLRA